MLENVAPLHLPAESDVAFEAADFGELARMAHEIAGFRIDQTGVDLVFSRLVKHVRRLGLQSFGDYLRLVRDPAQTDERMRMISALTTNTTRFFREDYHFETFTEDVLPRLRRTAETGGRVRLWSAGCSTGEEPYSLAAVILRGFPQAGRYDFKLLATDINTDVLSKAAAAQYPAGVAASIPADLRETLFGPDEEAGAERRTIRPEVRALVTFRFLNLMQPWPVRGPFDAIFCRNVMIYMAEADQAKVWAGMDRVLAPHGYLFIGHSERIGPEFKDRFKLCGNTTFIRPD